MNTLQRPLVIFVAATSLTLSGCASMTQQRQSSATGAGAGAALGALIGGLTEDWQGTWIGAGAGALLGGLARFSLALDRLTQSTARTANEWQQNFSAQQEATRVTPVTLANGQKAQQIDEMRLTVPSTKMVSSGQLSQNGETAIRKLIANARETGGSVQISYPASAPQAVVQRLLDTGVTVRKGAPGNDYVFVIERTS